LRHEVPGVRLHRAAGLAGVLNREEQETKAAWPWISAMEIGSAAMDGARMDAVAA